MGMSTGAGSALRADINVTPLVDVVLVLLIIFMVVTPLMQLGYTIDVPGEGIDHPPRPPVVLLITAASCPLSLGPGAVLPGSPAEACRVRLGEETVSLADLPAKAGALFEHRAGSDRVLFISAEESLNYEEVLRIIDAARSAAGRDLRIAIVTNGPPEPLPVSAPAPESGARYLQSPG